MATNFLGQPILNPDDPGLGPTLLGVTWSFTSLCIIAVGLRFYGRAKLSQALGWDDWIMLAALVAQIAGQAALTESCHWGLGKSYDNLTLEEYTHQGFWQFIVEKFAFLEPMLARASIAILLIRIFGFTRLWFKWFVIVYIIATWITGLIALVITFTEYRPLAAFWDPTIKPTYHMSQYVDADVSMVFLFLLAISDFLFVLLPVLFIWKLSMALRRKLALILLLSVSLITMGVSSAKIGISMVGILGRIDFFHAAYIAAVFYIVSFVEQSVVIIMGCVPSLGSFAQLDFPLFVSIGNSLNSLISRKDRRKKTSTDQSSTLHDIEMGPKFRISDDERSASGKDITTTLMPKQSNQSIGSDGRILRTDDVAFTRASNETH